MIDEFAVCSIATNNYLPYALTFYLSLQKNNPGVKYILFTIGDLAHSDLQYFHDECPNLEIVEIESILSSESLHHYVTTYTPFEVSCALRGVCHQFMNEAKTYNSWLMVDLDTVIVGSLESIAEILSQKNIFLTAHCSAPVPLDDAMPFEKNLLINGLYNGGVVGFSRSSQTSKAISWLKSRLEHFSEASRARISQGMISKDDCFFVDQLWLNLLPIYFSSAVYISSDPCHNLGHWNLWQGSLVRDDVINSQYLFDGRKVLILHFSGLPKDNLENVTDHTNFYLNNQSRVWADAARVFLGELAVSQSLLSFSKYFYEKNSPSSNRNKKPSIYSRVINKLLSPFR